MLLYIAGPMRGIPYYNYPAFDHATDVLRQQGHEPINPADLDRAAGFSVMSLPADSDWNAIPEGFDFEACLDRDIKALRRAEGLALLPGWERSTGANAEKGLAEWQGIPIFYFVDDYLLPSQPPRPGMDEGEDPKHEDKPRPSLILEGFPRALRYMVEVMEGGARKYAPHDWKATEDGVRVYTEKLYRHIFEHAAGHEQGKDLPTPEDSPHPSIIHAAADALIVAEIALMAAEKDDHA